MDDIAAWSRNTIYGFSFESPPTDTSTSVSVRMSRSIVSGIFGSSANAVAPANLLLFAQSHQAVVISYSLDGMIEGVSAVVEL